MPGPDSTTALKLEELQQSMLVLGGGYVGAELAQMFARAGTTCSPTDIPQPMHEPMLGPAGPISRGR